MPNPKVLENPVIEYLEYTKEKTPAVDITESNSLLLTETADLTKSQLNVSDSDANGDTTNTSFSDTSYSDTIPGVYDWNQSLISQESTSYLNITKIVLSKTKISDGKVDEAENIDELTRNKKNKKRSKHSSPKPVYRNSFRMRMKI